MTSQLYEYRVLHWTEPMADYEMDAMADERWRLIAVVLHRGTLLHYFERPRGASPPQVRPDLPAGPDPRDPT